MNSHRKQLKQTRRCVIKIGSSLLTAEGQGLDHKMISATARQMAELKSRGIQPILVSSGAVAEGMQRLGWTKRPQTLHELQAAAAVGQMGLVQAYESEFQKHDIHTAQILLTHDDLSDRSRYLNARSTLRTIIGLGVVPVINENDTVTTEEIQFGDNDSLAALAVNLVEADILILLTDQKGLYQTDPRSDNDAQLVQETFANDSKLDTMVKGAPGSCGSGGMFTKLRAARLAARSGATTVIAHGSSEDILLQIMDGQRVGTMLVPDQLPVAARKQWLAGHLQPRGQLILDAGAIKVLTQAGRSLLPVGVTRVIGDFQRGELVVCVDNSGQEYARGLVNYNAEESRKIAGKSSAEIETLLGYVDEPELVHRDNLVLI